MPSILRLQRDAEKLIRRWGGDKYGKIMRDGAARASAYMAIAQYSPTQRALFRDDSVRIVVSAVGLADIDFEVDKIVFLGHTYAITQPTTGGRPDGTIVLHDCNAVRLKDA